jgi:hypothetical protein
LKAESDIWNSLRRFCPRNKKRAKTMKRVKLALRAISFLSLSDAPSVKVRKSGAPPMGSTTVNRARKLFIKKPISIV